MLLLASQGRVRGESGASQGRVRGESARSRHSRSSCGLIVRRMCRLFGKPRRGVWKDPERDVSGVGPVRKLHRVMVVHTLISQAGVQCMPHAMAL